MIPLDEVQKIYNDVSEWLKFAEAKHAGLFAIWIALLIGVVSTDLFSTLNMTLQVIIIIVILLGSSINLFSFVPFLNRFVWLKNHCFKKYSSIGENVVFYQSIFVKTYKDTGELKVLFFTLYIVCWKVKILLYIALFFMKVCELLTLK